MTNPTDKLANTKKEILEKFERRFTTGFDRWTQDPVIEELEDFISTSLDIISKVAKEEVIKKVEQEMLDRVMHIGEEVPEYFTTEKRTKFILLGCPQDILDNLAEENR